MGGARRTDTPGLDEIAAELIQAKEAARLLGMTVSGVRWYADKGELPCLRLESGVRLYRRTDVEALKKTIAAKPKR